MSRQSKARWLIKIKPPVPYSKFLVEVVFLIKLLSTSMYQDRWCVLIAIFGDRTIKGSLALLDTDQTSTLQIGLAVRPNNLLKKDETRAQFYFLPWWKPCFCQLCEHLRVRSLDGGDTQRRQLPRHADCENLSQERQLTWDDSLILVGLGDLLSIHPYSNV